MHRLRSPSASISYDRYGEGPPLVLVHGSFSNHTSNWEFVKPLLEDRFTVYAVARRGRGETDATNGHSVLEEGADVATVLAAIGEPALRAGEWDTLATTFFRDLLAVPAAELDGLRSSPLWPPIVADAKASFGDVRALLRYEFVPERFRTIACPVLLQIGTESARHLYVTDALAGVFSDVRIEALPGQAHEGMTTAPEMYAATIARFLLG